MTDQIDSSEGTAQSPMTGASAKAEIAAEPAATLQAKPARRSRPQLPNSATAPAGQEAPGQRPTGQGEEQHPPHAAPSKLDRLLALLAQPGGATLAELRSATGWQAHSVRGAMAGALRRKGHVVSSQKQEGVRRYRLERAS